MLEKLFQLKAHNTNVRTEILAGITTFLAMAYILFVNPSILGETGMDKGAVFVATCLAAAIGSTVMGLIANYPIALAPGMGLNAFFTYTVVLHMGHTWQVALGAVFISAVLFFLLSIFRIREWIINSIPLPLRSAIAAGIGLFLAIIALQKSGVIVGNEDTLVALGPLNTAPPLLALAGFLLIAVLEARRIRGAILIGILAVTGAGWALGDVQYQGLVSLPPSLAPTFLQLDLPGLLHHDGGAPLAVLLQVVLVFVLVEVFDATGTLYGVVGRAGLLKLPGAQKRFGRALLADSTAIVAGSLLGTSSTTAFAESASGVQVGGRTGLTALVVSALFLAALLFSPLAAMVPSYATAPALLFVAGLMLRELVEVDWSDLTESVPAALCALAMPFTYSIANGLAFGFIAHFDVGLHFGAVRQHVQPAGDGRQRGLIANQHIGVVAVGHHERAARAADHQRVAGLRAFGPRPGDALVVQHEVDGQLAGLVVPPARGVVAGGRGLLALGVAAAFGGQHRQHHLAGGVGEEQLDVVVGAGRIETGQVVAAQHDAAHVRGDFFSAQHGQFTEAHIQAQARVVVFGHWGYLQRCRAVVRGVGEDLAGISLAGSLKAGVSRYRRCR